MERIGGTGAEEELVGEVSKIAQMVNSEGDEGQGVAVDGTTTGFGDGEFALSSCMVNGMSQTNGMVLYVQFSRACR